MERMRWFDGEPGDGRAPTGRGVFLFMASALGLGATAMILALLIPATRSLVDSVLSMAMDPVAPYTDPPRRGIGLRFVVKLLQSLLLAVAVSLPAAVLGAAAGSASRSWLHDELWPKVPTERLGALWAGFGALMTVLIWWLLGKPGT
jgi:hypothetical protein